MTALAAILLAAATLSATAQPDPAVESGRESLDHLWRYPWYDSESDGIQRVDVKEPYSWDWLTDWFDGVFGNWNFNWSPGGAGGFRWPTTLFGWFAWVAIFLLFVVLVWLLYRAFRRWAGDQDVDEEEGEGATSEEQDRQRVEALPFPVRQPQADLLEAAGQARDEGNFGEAIVYLFSYQLVQLDKHRLIRLAKGKTNRQYLGEVGRRSSLHGLLEQTMLVFEDVFFGNRTIDRGRFDRCWSRLGRFQSLLAEVAP